MHYVGMAAADISSNSVCQTNDELRGNGLYALIAGSTISLLFLTLIVSAFDRHMSSQHDRLEVEVERRTADLSKALEAAEIANRTKNEFLAAVSHELRTPLTSIRGFSELIEMTTKDAAAKSQAKLIKKSAEHLNALLTDILDFSKMQAGAMQLHYEEVDIQKLVREVVDFFEISASKKGLTLFLICSSNLPQTVNCDALRIRQILNNLLSNAFKFTSIGGVEVTVLCEDENLVFHVRDTGVGIPENIQEMIFEKFRQANDRISHDHGGTGLGLALSRDLAHLMSGSLVVKSLVGVGSQFTLKIPRV